jgi:2-polyprenyl-3-methyl-5-hydroxy-6-metoxy-1,4-benzoquinol methylase
MTTSSATETKQDFGSRLLRDNAAAIRHILCYMGDRLGLFRALQESGKTTLPEFAKKTGMNERYLREWLSAMVAGEYAKYDPATQTYWLPAEQASYLADENSPTFSASMFDMTKALWDVAPSVMDCFAKGGGVPHSKQSKDMDCGTERYSSLFFRFHLAQEWIPKAGLEAKLKSGARVADIGCGTGSGVLMLSETFPKSEVWGYDNYSPVIDTARKTAAERGLKNAHFEATAAENIDKSKKFDVLMTVDVIHDMADPLGGLRSIKDLLAPDGSYLMVEMNVSDRLEENINPFASMLYSISTLYCMTVSLAENGAGIGACMGERRARELASQAGFSSFERLTISHPFAAVYLLKP